MVDEGGDDRPGSGRILALELREHEHGTELAMMRIPRSGIPEDAWTHRFGSREAARRIFLIMMETPQRWAAWTRMAELLGADFLAGVIEAEVMAVGREAAQDAGGTASDRRRSGRKAIDDDMVHMSLVLGNGRPRIVGIRGGRRFLMLAFEETAAARRVWDWVRWQSHLYQAWYGLAAASGAAALVHHVTQAMLADERLFGSPSADEARPLRNWRPRPPPDE